MKYNAKEHLRKLSSSGVLVRQIQIVSQGAGTVTPNSSTDVTIDLTPYGFKTVPIAIPILGGWINSSIVTDSLSTTSVTLRAWNFSNASHSGAAMAVLIELI